MALITPVQLFPGFTSDGTLISFPIADLEGLSAAEADPNTGNAMEIIRVILEKGQAQLNALVPSAKPVRSSLTKAVPTISPSPGVPPGTLRQVYTFSADLTPTGLQPTAE
jgi:hypothetical protein